MCPHYDAQTGSQMGPILVISWLLEPSPTRITRHEKVTPKWWRSLKASQSNSVTRVEFSTEYLIPEHSCIMLPHSEISVRRMGVRPTVTPFHPNFCDSRVECLPLPEHQGPYAQSTELGTSLATTTWTPSCPLIVEQPCGFNRVHTLKKWVLSCQLPSGSPVRCTPATTPWVPHTSNYLKKRLVGEHPPYGHRHSPTNPHYLKALGNPPLKPCGII